MAPIAQTLISMGFKVTGSDSRDPMQHFEAGLLASQCGHKPEQIKRANIVVLSSAIPESNPELIWAKENDMTIVHRSDILNALMQRATLSIGISGTSGKTTTSGLCLAALKTFLPAAHGILGASARGHKQQESITGPYTVVAELDESDGSIIKYAPNCLVVHNIDKDHMGTYGSEDKIAEAFFKTAKNITSKGSLAVNWDHPKCRKLYRKIEAIRSDLSLWSYGRSIGCDLRLLERATSGFKQRIKVQCLNQTIELEVPGVGEYFVSNTLAALAAATAIGQTPASAARGIEGFPGLSRRMELVQKTENQLVYSDYAHNPEKVAAAISGLKEAFPHKKICALFQPHRYSRTVELWDDFLKSFNNIDQLYVLPIFSAGETEPKGFSLQDFCQQIERTSNCQTKIITNREFADLTWFSDKSSDIAYIALGAGDIHSMLCSSLKPST